MTADRHNKKKHSVLKRKTHGFAKCVPFFHNKYLHIPGVDTGVEQELAQHGSEVYVPLTAVT